MARLPWTKDCQLKGCQRAEYKGGMCRKHWLSVPFEERSGVAITVFAGQMRLAAKEHRRLRQIARKIAATERS